MKERLTGAIILVVLIVLLVPELLSGPKGPATGAPVGAAPPSSEEPPLRSYTINLGDDAHSQSEPAGSAAATNGPAMPQPSGPEQPTVQLGGQQAPGAAGSPSTPSQSAPGQSTGTPPTVNPQPANSEASAPAVQGGSSGEETAPAQKPVATPNAPPAPKPSSPTSAPATRTDTPKPPHAAVAAPKPSGTHPAAAANTATRSGPGAWAVQLGVFRSRENAERLALEVRVKGFKVSVTPVSTGQGKRYRVRVGPTADRAAAQELQGRLKAAGRPDGTVVPYS